MSIDMRKRQFSQALHRLEAWTPGTKLSDNFGVSNRALVLAGGLFAGVTNLESWKPERNDQLVLGCLLTAPPEDEIFFAVFIKSDLELLTERLRVMTSGITGENEELAYSRRNNLVCFYLADDGRLYLRNKGFWNDLLFDRSIAQPAPSVDKIALAFHPPGSTQRHLFRDYFASLVGGNKVIELPVWAQVSERPMPKDISAEDVEHAIEARGGYYPQHLVRALHSGLNYHPRKHFVILSGLSGSGKTMLAIEYARAALGKYGDADEADARLVLCPVRPDWTDPVGLIGYYDVLSKSYIVPPFLNAVLLANANPGSPVFVILDEMNLARVEYYLADVLSGMESGGHLQLHSGSHQMKDSTGTTIPPSLPLPPNLYIIGTINIDETTHPVSDKVLDRAVLIDMSAVDIPGFLDSLGDKHRELTTSIDQVRELLAEVHRALAKAGLAFGYRTAEEVVRFHHFARTKGQLSDEQTLDGLMLHKVLPRLRGSERQRTLLNELESRLEEYPRSLALIERLQQELNDHGSFQANR